MTHVDSVESAGGRLGAVLSVPRTGLAKLGPRGPWLAATPALARQVLTDVERFDFHGDVSRSADLSRSTGDTRSGHVTFAPLGPDQVARGVATFRHEWDAALHRYGGSAAGGAFDAMDLLREPIALSTTAAVLPHLDEQQRADVAHLTLEWIDALGPVIAARRPPGRLSRARRLERRARLSLEDTLDEMVGPGMSAPLVATMLAAGIQVPIAAGAWLLAWLADDPTRLVEPVQAVWETLRLTPPTWATARVTTQDVDLGGERVPSGAVVLVSPLLLGRAPELVPGDPGGLGSFDPGRWHDSTQRPGAWLPFGAGPHACPGRSLGMAQLVELATWGTHHQLTLCERVGIDQSRGIAPLRCRLTAAARG